MFVRILDLHIGIDKLIGSIQDQAINDLSWRSIVEERKLKKYQILIRLELLLGKAETWP